MIWRMVTLVGCLMLFSMTASADTRYIIEGTNIGSGAGISNRLEVEFVKDKISTVVTKGVSAGSGQRIVAIACVQSDGDLFLDTLTDSSKYSLYKVKVSETGAQALFIFGFSEDLGGHTRTVNEARVIAMDENGMLINHRVKGFSPLIILKIPMQLNANKELFFMEPDGAEVVFKYDPMKRDFVFARK